MYNLFLILLVLKILFLTIMLETKHLDIYNKIFNNQKNLYNQKLSFDIVLANACKHQIINNSIGFLFDDLFTFSNSGLNIYKISNQNTYGYMGCRGIESIDLNEIVKANNYYQNLLIKYGLVMQQIKSVSFNLKKNLVEQIFLIQNATELWRYDVIQGKFFLEYDSKSIGAKIINYIITANILKQHNNSDLKLNNYLIYLHLSGEKDTLQCIIKSNDSNQNNKKIVIFNTNNKILNFFIRCNNIIIFYQDLKLNPEIYKIIVDNYIDRSKIIFLKLISKQIDFKKIMTTTANNELLTELLWDQLVFMHRLNINYPCGTISYLFNLNNDNILLGYRSENN